MKNPLCILVFLALTVSSIAGGLPISVDEEFYDNLTASGLVSCGGFSFLGSFGKSSVGTVTNDMGFSTIGSALAVATVGSSEESGTAGTITMGSNPANTWIPGNIIASGTAGFSNQQFYCINPTPFTNIYAVASGGGSVGIVGHVFNCTGTPVFRGQTGAGASSGITIQTGTLTPSGTNLFVSSATYDVLNAGNSTAPTLQNIDIGSDAVPEQGWTNSASALNVTWTNDTSAAKAVSMMMFGSTGCSGGGGATWAVVFTAFINGNGDGVTTSTSPPVDSTGATLIVATVEGADFRTFIDNKLNIYTSLNDAGGTPRENFRYVISPTVGTGHTFSLTQGASGYVIGLKKTAGGTPVFDAQASGASGNFNNSQPFTPGSITPATSSDILLSAVILDGAATGISVDSGFGILDTQTATSGRVIYFGTNQPASTSAVNPTWSQTGTGQGGAVNHAAFK